VNEWAATPVAIAGLKVKELGTPALGRDSRPLGGNDLVWHVH
jgi:hypothetical protein